MKIISIIISSAILLLVFVCSCSDVRAPEPYGELPSEAQMEWQKMEYYMFVHFGPNTFTNVEWGNGSEDPNVFNPTDLDCRQWAATAKAAGMKAIIITAKHHDGFCLWPSKYSTHTVKESSWQNGQGDVLKELQEACKEYGLKFGVYLSPWDRNHPTYGTLEYNELFANTLDEVYTNYGGGEIFEQWFDGAQGEGPNGKKQDYDWELFHRTVFKHNPDVIIFSDVGPGCRWMGNESGIAGETNWSRLNVAGFAPGAGSPEMSVLNSGDADGELWVPAETDVSIRPGWFYSPETDDKLKSLEHLIDIYYTSVGRNSNLLLNVPPDKRGRIHPNDSIRLMEFRCELEKIFENNLAKNAKIKASAERGKKFGASNILNDKYDSYWAVPDNDSTPYIEVEFVEEQTFNRILLQEYIPLGQRVVRFSVDYWDELDKKWNRFTDATTIGYKRILRFPTIMTKKIKINIEESLACPILNNLEIYYAPEQLAAPMITRNKEGEVYITTTFADPVIYYTLDGTNPTSESEKYLSSFKLPNGGTVKAVAIVENGKRRSEIVSEEFGLASAKWKVLFPADENTDMTIDGNKSTSIKVDKKESLIIDLGEYFDIQGFYYIPVNQVTASHVTKYNFYLSDDGNQWDEVIVNSEFNNIVNNPIRQNIKFENIYKTRYVKLEPIETSDNKTYSIAEIGVIGL